MVVVYHILHWVMFVLIIQFVQTIKVRHHNVNSLWAQMVNAGHYKPMGVQQLIVSSENAVIWCWQLAMQNVYNITQIV